MIWSKIQIPNQGCKWIKYLLPDTIQQLLLEIFRFWSFLIVTCFTTPWPQHVMLYATLFWQRLESIFRYLPYYGLPYFSFRFVSLLFFFSFLFLLFRFFSHYFVSVFFAFRFFFFRFFSLLFSLFSFRFFFLSVSFRFFSQFTGTRLEEFNWHWSVATPPLEPQAPGRIEEKNGCWLDGIE